MSIKILTKNSIDNTNIDGARANHFSAGMRSGIVKGAYNEGTLFTPANNKIALDSCELRISGHQVVIDSAEIIELQNAPSQPTKMSIIAEIQVNDSSVPAFRLFVQNESVKPIQDNLFKTNNGKGTYQLRIGNFLLGTTGIISDVIRTADIITGGGEGGVADIKFNATATQLSSSSQPEANADYNEETKEWDLHFGIPAGSGTNVTIGGVIQGEWSADFAESERQKSKNLLKLKDSYTRGNVTVDINKETGLITFNGTVNTESYYISETYIYLKAGKTYTLSVQNYNGSGRQLLTSGARKVSDWSAVSDYLYTYGERGTITPVEDMVITDFKFYFSDSHDVNFSCYVQVEEGGQSDYVKYQGGRLVHEEDIADVEHYEKFYSVLDGKTTINNEDFGSGLPINTNITSDTFSKYKALIIKSKRNEQLLVSRLEVVEDYLNYSSGIMLNHNGGYLIIHNFSYNKNYKSFNFVGGGYCYIDGVSETKFNSESSESNNLIYEIVGVLK